MSRMTRRLLVLSGGTVLAGAAVYGGSLLACSARSSEAARSLGDPTRLFAALADMPEPEAVAEAVLRGRTPIRPERLLEDLAGSPPIRAACRLDCTETRRGALRQAFRAEFRAGGHTLAAGWVLAPSEARIAALWGATLA